MYNLSHQPLCDLQAITAVSSPGDHRVIDVFVLFVLHSTATHKKNVEKIFSNKIRTGCFSSDLMNSTFGSHPGVSADMISILLKILSVCLSVFLTAGLEGLLPEHPSANCLSHELLFSCSEQLCRFSLPAPLHVL